MTITLIAAQSLDGRITKHHLPGSDFTSEADKSYFSKALRDFDCRVLGSTSYEARRDGTRRSAEKGRYHLVLSSKPGRYAAEAIPNRLEFSDATPENAAKLLQTKGFSRCALIGGGQVHAAFLKAGLVDELWITLEPLLFGAGTALVSGAVDIRLRLLSQESLSSDTLLLKYTVLRP